MDSAKEGDLGLMRTHDECHRQRLSHGSRRLWGGLENLGYVIGRKPGQRLQGEGTKKPPRGAAFLLICTYHALSGFFRILRDWLTL